MPESRSGSTPSLTSPYRFYQYWVDADDQDVGVYLRWFTMLDRGRIEELEAEHAAAPERRVSQRALARDVTEVAHGRGAAERVARVSEILFGGDPTLAGAQALADLAAEIPTSPWPEDGASMDVLTILVATGAAGSRADARRLVEQGGVHVNGALVREIAATFGPDDLLAGRYLLVRRGKRDQRMIVRGLGRA